VEIIKLSSINSSENLDQKGETVKKLVVVVVVSGKTKNGRRKVKTTWRLGQNANGLQFGYIARSVLKPPFARL
jgi:hypothetical protein